VNASRGDNMISEKEIFELWTQLIKEWDAYWEEYGYYGSCKRGEMMREEYMRGKLHGFKILCNQDLAHKVAMVNKE
jgi:hypothetical protein